MQHGKLRTDRCPWFIDRFFQLSYTYISTIVTADSVVSTLRPETTRSESMSGQARGDLSPKPTETETANKNEDIEPVRGDLLRDLPEWLGEFTEKPCGQKSSIPAQMDAPASSFRH